MCDTKELNEKHFIVSLKLHHDEMQYFEVELQDERKFLFLKTKTRR